MDGTILRLLSIYVPWSTFSFRSSEEQPGREMSYSPQMGSHPDPTFTYGPSSNSGPFPFHVGHQMDIYSVQPAVQTVYQQPVEVYQQHVEMVPVPIVQSVVEMVPVYQAQPPPPAPAPRPAPERAAATPPRERERATRERETPEKEEHMKIVEVAMPVPVEKIIYQVWPLSCGLGTAWLWSPDEMILRIVWSTRIASRRLRRSSSRTEYRRSLSKRWSLR